MFLPFYGLQEQPFGVTPDPRFLYLTPSHREAIASLYCAIESGRGFSAMVAQPGMGKTSILFRFLETLESRARTAFLFQSDCNSRQLFQSLLLDVGLKATNDLVRMRQSLNRLLLEERRAGRRFVVVIDEAQNLSAEVLESIRLLSNFETPTEKLLHIVLAGQPQLATTLARPDMVQFSQRVSAVIRLVPLSLGETKAYIRHRLSIAGYSGSDVFTDDAYAQIAQLSEGIPRNISSICFQAMSIGCALQKVKIDAGIIAEVANDLCIGSEKTPASLAPSGGPVSDQSWSTPELSSFSSTRLRMSLQKRGLWQVGLAMSALLLVPLFVWQMASRRKLELKPKSAVIQPTTYSQVSPAQATPKSPPAVSLVIPSNAVPPGPMAPDGTDGSTKSIEMPLSSQSSNAVNVATTGQLKTKPPAALINSKEARVSLPVHDIARRQVSPRVVYIEKPETLFEVALENYGKSNWELVNRIQTENPSLQDPYVILSKGQRLVLPDVLASDLDKKQN